ncbi:TPA: hypothetical protein ACGEGF_001865 [Yersinia enterocolitica]
MRARIALAATHFVTVTINRGLLAAGNTQTLHSDLIDALAEPD